VYEIAKKRGRNTMGSLLLGVTHQDGDAESTAFQRRIMSGPLRTQAV
jgi:hypothetical protein